MANMTFKTNILPNSTTKEYSLGSLTNVWNIYGDLTGDVTGDVTGSLTGNVSGDVVGNVTGNLSGNVNGDVSGNVTGNVTGSLTGNADTATAANITTTANAVATYNDAVGTFDFVSSGNGALYATSTDGTVQFGTLPVGQGGTGAQSFTANAVLKGNGTSAVAASGVSIDGSNNVTGVVGLTATGVITTTNTTASTSTATGAIKCSGGVGVAGQVTALRLAANGSNTNYNLYVNGTSYLNGNSTVKTVIGTSSSTYGSTLPSSATEGQIFFQLSDGINTAGKITTVAATSATKYYLVGTEGTGSYTPYVATPNASGTQNVTGVYFQGSTGVLFGAAWNDYAEYRKKKDIEGIPYGYVVIENGDDTVSFSTERLQPCGQIVSDTFGFILGPEEDSLPIALCGRVLAYTYEDRNSFSVGDAVCTAPGGKISKMTREEIREWPDRILGYVSSIPQYQIWENKNIIVNGRIWIKVK